MKQKQDHTTAPLLYRWHWLLGLLMVIGLALVVSSATETPVAKAESADLNRARSQYSNIVGTQLDSCNLCHPSGSWNFNSYGQAYDNNGGNSNALVAIENLDSDGDGYSNIAELMALTFPGDANSVPMPTATATSTAMPTPTSTPTSTPTPTPTATPIPAPDLRLVKQVVGNDSPAPGEVVTFTLSIANNGILNATDVVVRDLLPSDTLSVSPTWQHSASLAGTTERSGSPFVWDLPDLAPHAEGVLTISVQINPALPLDFAIVNQASISTSVLEINTDNNSSSAIVGGQRLYLPIILN